MESCVGSFIRPPYRTLPPEFNALQEREKARALEHRRCQFEAGIVSMKIVVFATLQNDAAP